MSNLATINLGSAQKVSDECLEKLQDTDRTELCEESFTCSPKDGDADKVECSLRCVLNRKTRAAAIVELSRHLHTSPRLGLIIYGRSAVLSSVLMEIMEHYPNGVKHAELQQEAVDVICGIVAIFQKIILDREVRLEFLKTDILLYLLPYLNRTEQTRETEQLRVSLLGLFATATSKVSVETMELLLLRLPTNQDGSAELPTDTRLYDYTVAALSSSTSNIGKTMALILLTRLLVSTRQLTMVGQDNQRVQKLVAGLSYIIKYVAKKFNPCNGLSPLRRGMHSMADVHAITWEKAKRLLRFFFGCLYRVSIEPHIRLELVRGLPNELRGRLFASIFEGDNEVDGWLEELWNRLNMEPPLRVLDGCCEPPIQDERCRM
ncbi:cell differentiation protein RCD1 homolog [Clonorchis sinensis]|uniref:CCR4-NOT transcription complex subunit 9 n=1 Tax=Clonorchis sinensis TaxID=79923 RepID=G7Y5S1_CLOSI|nr:cell differentiation protein RCD1 homolog [Clonorchis sinensis]